MERRKLFRLLCDMERLNTVERRRAAGALSAYLRNPGDAIKDDIDAVAFAVARVYHSPSPGWIPAIQATFVTLEKRLREAVKADETNPEQSHG
jgi:hypothetical protein